MYINIIRKLLTILALFFMPLGLMLAIQGNYFYNITSKEAFDKLADNIISESIQKEHQSICFSLNISCASIKDIVNGICEKSNRARRDFENALVDTAKYLNSSINETFDIACNQSAELCNQLSLAKEQVESMENLCAETKKYKQEIEKQRDELYYKPVFRDISLNSINAMLSSAFLKGIAIFIASIVIIYISSRSLFTLLKSVFAVSMMTGLTCLSAWYFGPMLIKDKITMEMPVVLKDFIQGIFEFEYSIGVAMLLVGILGFIAVFILMKLKRVNKKRGHQLS
ncbi:MAG: hypothetical protein QXQ40_02335 [Candidatus Aenigmatarchaeota archaeon]